MKRWKPWHICPRCSKFKLAFAATYYCSECGLTLSGWETDWIQILFGTDSYYIEMRKHYTDNRRTFTRIMKRAMNHSKQTVDERWDFLVDLDNQPSTFRLPLQNAHYEPDIILPQTEISIKAQDIDIEKLLLLQ